MFASLNVAVNADRGVEIDDITPSVERLARTLAIARVALDNRVPAVNTHYGPMSIDLSEVVSDSRNQRTTLLESVKQLLSAVMFRRLDVVFIDRARALWYFREGMFSFLYERFEARDRSESDRPGRLFEVTTNTEGLRVHYSPAFILERDRVFGEPTNPVSSWIQPGCYYFGAMGPNVDLWFDMDAKYEIPRTGRAHLNV